MSEESKKILVVVTVACLAATLWISYWQMTSEPRKSVSCIGRLRTISMATLHWITTHDGQTPPSLKALLGRPGVTSKTFICPASGNEPDDDEFICDYDSMFDRAGRPVSYKSIGNPSKTLMVWDREAVHNDGAPYRYAIFAGGSLQRVYEEEFEAARKVPLESGPAKE